MQEKESIERKDESSFQKADERIVTLLNTILEMDREGISRFFYANTMVDVKIANTSVELFNLFSDKHSQLTALGLINGILHLFDDNTRLNVEMRNGYLIERFVLQPTGEFNANHGIHDYNVSGDSKL